MFNMSLVTLVPFKGLLSRTAIFKNLFRSRHC